jgi:predicted dehydrogenase
VESVVAFTAVRAHDAARLEVEDTCVAVLRFRDGSLGQLLAATSLYPGQLRRLLVGGRDGTAEILEEQLVGWRFRAEVPDDDATRSRFGGASGTSGGAADPMAINYACHTLLPVGADGPPGPRRLTSQPVQPTVPVARRLLTCRLSAPRARP